MRYTNRAATTACSYVWPAEAAEGRSVREAGLAGENRVRSRSTTRPGHRKQGLTPAKPAPVASVFPSLESAMFVTYDQWACPSSRSVPVPTSQKLTAESPPPVMSTRLSEENTIPLTQQRWTPSVVSRSPATGSQMIAVASSLAEASILLLAENTIS
jgi:hypothetical protein